MAIGGKVREKVEFSKKVGLFEGKVISINPDREELSELLGTNIEKDPEYLSTFKDKDADNNEIGSPITKLNIVIWLEDVKTKLKFPLTFYLRNKNRVSKEKGSTQFINGYGITSWADNENNLKDKFKERGFRIAREGEEELYKFLRWWLAKIEWKEAGAVLELDWKKLMNGNVKELREQISGAYEDTVNSMAIVRKVDEKDSSGEKTGESKYYQSVYNRDFLPGYTLKFFKTSKFTDERIEDLREKDKIARAAKKGYLKPFEKFVLGITDPQYGCKNDAFYLGELKDFNPEEFLETSEKIIEGDASY